MDYFASDETFTLWCCFFFFFCCFFWARERESIERYVWNFFAQNRTKTTTSADALRFKDQVQLSFFFCLIAGGWSAPHALLVLCSTDALVPLWILHEPRVRVGVTPCTVLQSLSPSLHHFLFNSTQWGSHWLISAGTGGRGGGLTCRWVRCSCSCLHPPTASNLLEK